MVFFPKVLDILFGNHKHLTKVLDFWFIFEIFKIHGQVWICNSILLFLILHTMHILFLNYFDRIETFKNSRTKKHAKILC
jgi:hypothetical protein